jgi:chromosomal replication initiator protein
MTNRKIDEKIIDYIATNIKSNIRELEGAFNKIFAFAKLNKVELNLEMAKEALKDVIYPNKPKEITSTLIINVVAEQFGVRPDEITSKKRNAEIVIPRQVVMFLCRELTSMPYKSIGNILGKKDHTTIMHGAEKISDDIKTNQDLRNKVELIRKKLNPT